MNPFTKINLQQGTPEWLEFRLSKVTASQVPVLLKLSPHQTPFELWEEKTTGKEKNSGNEFLFAKGHSAEAASRNYLEKTFNKKFSPAVLQSNIEPILMASLDGLNEELNTIIEAKYVGQESLKKIKNSELPLHHLAQIQASLFVAGSKKCIYFATTDSGDSALLEIAPDKDYHSLIVEQAKKFWDLVTSKTAPGLTEKDYYVPDNDSRFEQFEFLDREIKRLEDEREAIAKEIKITYKAFPRVKFGNVIKYESVSRGNVDYSKIPVLQGLDLEKYRKPSKTSVTVKVSTKKDKE